MDDYDYEGQRIRQQREVNRGEQAKLLLNDPLMQEVLQHLKTSVREALFSLPLAAKEQREQLFLLDRAREQFVNCLTVLITGGEVMKAELTMQDNARIKARQIMESF